MIALVIGGVILYSLCGFGVATIAYRSGSVGAGGAGAIAVMWFPALMLALLVFAPVRFAWWFTGPEADRELPLKPR